MKKNAIHNPLSDYMKDLMGEELWNETKKFKAPASAQVDVANTVIRNNRKPVLTIDQRDRLVDGYKKGVQNGQ